VFQAAGFREVAIVRRFDCFAGTTKERMASRYGVAGVNLCATKSAVATTA
jgi:hypothetical protein